MHIRLATPEDVPQLAQLFYNTIHTINAKDYTPEQLAAWAPAVPDPSAWIARKFPTYTTFVADDHGTIAGFAELEPNGHIDCFYTHHAYQRRGIGHALLTRLEQHARSLGLTSLFAEVSITARPFFEAHGFIVTQQQSILRRNISLTNFRMTKSFDSK